MKKGLFLTEILLVSFFGAGCAHMSDNHSRGAVVFTDSANEGHACIGRDEVKVGEIVDVFRTSCIKIDRPTKGNPDRKLTTCEKKFIGTAEVIAPPEEHFAKIKTIGSLTLEQGLIVEKMKVTK